MESVPPAGAGAPGSAPARVPVSATTSYLFVPGSALKPRNTSQETIAVRGGGCVVASGGDAFAVLNAPVILPPGSLVESVRFFFLDNSATSDGRAWFTVYDTGGDLFAETAADSTGNSGIVAVDTAAIDETIDYAGHSYALNFRPYELTDIGICGVRIAYRAPLPPLSYFQAEESETDD